MLDVTPLRTAVAARSMEATVVPAQASFPLRKSVPIALDNIVVVIKLTKVECDMRRLGLSFDETIKSYHSSGADISRIVLSHERQKVALNKLQELLPKARFISREALQSDEADLSKASLVIALGGDNHFQFVTHFVCGELPILGINSDPKTSFGALLSATSEQLPLVVEALETGSYALEPWVRMQSRIDGKELQLATSEIFAGEESRREMSRHTLARLSTDPARSIQSQEQKGSGLLIATGAGSTGWFQSAARYVYPDGVAFEKTDRALHFVLSEPSSTVIREGRPRTGQTPENSIGDLKPGERLRLQSLNDRKGIVSIDSLTDYSFDRGQVLEIAVSPEPLWVITFPNEVVC